MRRFADISHHQKGMNVVDVAKKNNLQMIMFKLSEGTGYTDDAANGYNETLKNSGIVKGKYHFGRPDLNGGNAKVEAEWFIKELKRTGTGTDEVIALDYEPEWNGNAYTWCKNFLDEVKKAYPKNRIWLYSNLNRVTSYGLDKMGYMMWVADYDSNNGQPNSKPNVSNLVAWQYTSKGKLSGYSGNVDMNECYVDLGTGTGTVENDKDISWAEAYNITTEEDKTRVMRVRIKGSYINGKDTFGYTDIKTSEDDKYTSGDKNEVAYPDEQGWYYGYLVGSRDGIVWAEISQTLEGKFQEFYLDMSKAWEHNYRGSDTVIEKLDIQSGL